METIKAIIIDDEELARELIKNYLREIPGIRIIAECENGFEMLELIDPPEIIFITAHNEFAIRAFEMNAVDYLLKPYSQERLIAAIQKARERIESGIKSSEAFPRLIQQPLTEKLERIVVKTGTKIKVIPVDRIHYFEAQDDFVMIYTDEGKHLKQGTMKYFEDHLDSSRFIRVHRSYIVRIDQVTQLEPYSKENYILKLKNGANLKVSRNGLKNLKDKFNF